MLLLVLREVSSSRLQSIDKCHFLVGKLRLHCYGSLLLRTTSIATTSIATNQKVIRSSTNGASQDKLYIVRITFPSFTKRIKSDTANRISFATDCWEQCKQKADLYCLWNVSTSALKQCKRGRRWSGTKLKKIAGGMHNLKLPTNRLSSSPNCRQIGLSLSFFSNITLASTIDIRQIGRQAKYWGEGASPRSPYG